MITLTRGRPARLARAAASVAAQDFDGAIEHLVLADDDPDSVQLVESLAGTSRHRTRCHLAVRPASEQGECGGERGVTYARCARLLNLGVRLAGSLWVAFLDDDNEYEPGHLRELAACAEETGADAVHSGRQMLNDDGSPYLEERFPHANDPRDGKRIYDLLCERGVWRRGTNVLLDRADPVQTTFANSTVMGDRDPVFLVDQNVWLIGRRLLLRHPVPETFSAADIEANTCADDKMLEVLVRNGVEISSTGRPTVRYYLGGMSNP